jgi:hypothetical protein
VPLLPIEAVLAVLPVVWGPPASISPPEADIADVSAQPDPEFERTSIELRWSAPPECADRDEVLRRLDRLVGERAVRIEGEGSIEHEGQGYVLRMHTRSRDGEGARTLRSDDCRMLAEAAALVLALTADPPLLLRRVAEAEAEAESVTEAEPEPEAEIETEMETDADADAEAPRLEPAVPRREAPRFGLRFAGIGGAGLVPGFSPGVAVSFALFGRNWRVESGWIHAFARRTQTGDGAEVPGDVQLSVGALRAGWVHRYKRLEVPLMAGIELGSLRAVTALRGGMQRRLWAAFTAGPSLAWVPHHNVALWAGVDAVLPYLRSAFVIENAGTLYRVPAVAMRGLLGLEVRLP